MRDTKKFADDEDDDLPEPLDEAWPVAVEFISIKINFESPASLSLRAPPGDAQAACPWAGPVRSARPAVGCAWLPSRGSRALKIAEG
jgi:hypothetical protein